MASILSIFSSISLMSANLFENVNLLFCRAVNQDFVMVGVVVADTNCPQTVCSSFSFNWVQPEKNVGTACSQDNFLEMGSKLSLPFQFPESNRVTN